MDRQSVSSKMDSRIVQFKKKNSYKISYLCCASGNRIQKNNVKYTETHIHFLQQEHRVPQPP